MKTILFDIDGTIADIKHRRHYLQKDQSDWKSFNAAMGDDVPNKPVVSLHRTLWDSGHYEVILVTGRNERFRSLTEHWLTWNEIPFGEILMRGDNDMRADHIIKEEILDRLINSGRSIEFVVDDRQQVVDMWRRNGITCFQCDVGNF